MLMNTSSVSDDITARTNPDAAAQRADNLASLGCKNVMELCVGPSLAILESFYNKNGINVTGNDIERRWQTYYPTGQWIIGDALKISYQGFDGIVFAPPLSKGCTGRREDALMIDQVFPKYTSFLERAEQTQAKVYTMVCPARSIATAQDRTQLFNLINQITIKGFRFEVMELRTIKRNIVKYIDIYFYR